MSEYADICEAITGFPMDRVVVIDTETTGVEPLTDQILSVSIVDARGRTLLNTLVHPRGIGQWPKAQRVNGISPKMVRSAPQLGRVADDIRRYVNDDHLVVLYNADFDLEVLRNQGVIARRPEHVFDVMREFSKIHGEYQWPDSDRYKWEPLTYCAETYGYRFKPHSSLGDAVATAWCLSSLLSDPDYIAYLAGSRRVEALRHVHVTQTRETAANVADFLGPLSSAEAEGTLEPEPMTRGKNAGAMRYVAEVDGAKVAVCSMAATAGVREFLMLGEDAQLPVGVPCTVQISKGTDRPSCSVELDGEPGYVGMLRELAATEDQERAKASYEPDGRTIPEPERGEWLRNLTAGQVVGAVALVVLVVGGVWIYATQGEPGLVGAGFVVLIVVWLAYRLARRASRFVSRWG